LYVAAGAHGTPAGTQLPVGDRASTTATDPQRNARINQ